MSAAQDPKKGPSKEDHRKAAKKSPTRKTGAKKKATKKRAAKKRSTKKKATKETSGTPATPGWEDGVLVVGKTAMPEHEDFWFDSVPDVGQATTYLRRAGFEYSWVYLGATNSDLDADVAILKSVLGSMSWITLGVERDPSSFRPDSSMRVGQLGDLLESWDRGSAGPIPFDAGDTRFYREVGPLLFSISFLTDPPSLEHDVFASPGTGMALPLAVDACLEAMRAAASQGATLVLELPEGYAEYVPEQLLSAIVESVDRNADWGQLRHVIYTIEDEDVFLDIVESGRQRAKQLPKPTVLNDTPRGDDKLGVVDEVNALTDAIALDEVEPPIVVGILGGWGTGKSFALHLMKRRLNELRKWDLKELRSRGLTPEQEQAQFPFVGHPYLVKFDAWTYAKQNLWASLMQRILVDLNRQFELERAAGTDALLEGFDLWQLTEDLTEKEIRAVVEDEEVAKRLIGSRSGGKVEEKLWESLQAVRKKTLEELERARKRLWVREARIARKREDLASTLALREARERVRTRIGELFVAAIDPDEHLGPAQKVEAATRRLIRKAKDPFVLFASMGPTEWMIALLGVVAYFALPEGMTLGALAAPLVAGIKTFQRIMGSIEEARGEVEQQVEESCEALAKGLSHPLFHGAEEEVGFIKELERKTDMELRPELSRLEARAGLVSQGPSLHDLVGERIQSAEYEQHLGLVHRIRQDIDHLSDALLQAKRGQNSDLFPRGAPRIVLVIDDLDRCPPEQVVAVLEAAQLLVKTKLFVVVLAMDVRYVTRALEKKYEGVLQPEGPSGLDYIEKIIQVPYRVPEIEPNAMRDYLASQMVVESDDEDPPEDPVFVSDGSRPARVFESTLQPPFGAPKPKLPTDALVFTVEELDVLELACKAAEISPRTAKRVVNVYKLLKIIWFHRGATPPEDEQHGMMLLIALSGVGAETMRIVLEGFDTRKGEEGTLIEVLREELKSPRCRKSSRELLRLLDRNEHDLPLHLPFSDLGESGLRLVRCFSFLGEAHHPHDPDAVQPQTPPAQPAPSSPPSPASEPRRARRVDYEEEWAEEEE